MSPEIRKLVRKTQRFTKTTNEFIETTRKELMLNEDKKERSEK
jgi:hypothetical protein